MARGPAVRWGVCAAMAFATFVSTGEAAANPVGGPRPMPRAKRSIPDDLESPFSGVPCERGTSWPKVKACLAHGGAIVTLLYDLPEAKLVSVRGNTSYDAAAVSLYTLRGKTWQRLSLYATTNSASEILSFSRMQKETGYKLEQGTVQKSWGIIGDQTRVPVILRRRLTSVCFDNGVCQTVYTSCEALVDGKAYWTFRGALSVDHGVIRVTGDKTYAGALCAPQRSTFTPEPVGDLLE